MVLQTKKGRQRGKPLYWFREILDIQREAEDTNDFVKKIKFDIFGNRIFVFSPKGDVFELPEGSTPIDYAYAVHTEIGNKATRALVNDKIADLDKELKSGDLVEIIIDKNRPGPNRAWLKFVKTANARNRIKHYSKTPMENFKNFFPKF
ncbi:MAG: TGS domain-containing protein [Patescibacteria group bacterium]|nr:TGS domain-containing protein [Patescibacteria group bacterium]